MTATPPLAGRSPSCSTRVPSGKISRLSPLLMAFRAFFTASMSPSPRSTGKAPSFRSTQSKTLLQNSSFFAMMWSR